MTAVLYTAGALSAADSVNDWTGRDNKPSNLTAGANGLNINGKEFYVFSTKSFPVKPDSKYVLSGTFRRTEGNKGNTPLYFGIAMYDKNGKWMNGFQACPIKDSQTELTAPAKKGDRVLKLKNASAWVKRASAAAFGAKADFSDLPNYDISPAITHIEKTGDEWEVTLRYPLNREYAAGTAVRQQSGPPYIYVRAGVPLNDEWQTFTSSVIHGPGVGGNRFWQGTDSVKIVMFGSIGKPAEISMKNIEFKEIK